METKKEVSSTLSWFSLFAGLAAGTALGIAFAPKPGRETRAKVRDWLKNKRDETRERLHTGRSRSYAEEYPKVEA